jgi:DNA invertase Pin-like site-specific DNA recombinase
MWPSAALPGFCHALDIVGSDRHRVLELRANDRPAVTTVHSLLSTRISDFCAVSQRSLIGTPPTRMGCMTTASAYIRVSSRAQDHATQRSAIERAAAARGDIIAAWYAEKKSARTMDREELRRLLAQVRAGGLRGQRLYLFRLDRLTRTGIADTLTTLEELRAHGVEVVSVADGFDLSGPHAEIIVATMAWAAKMERLAIGERVAAARERVEAEGRHWGRPRRVDAPTLRRIQALRAEGRSLRYIAVAMKIPKSTVAATLAAASRKTIPKTTPKSPRELGV